MLCPALERGLGGGFADAEYGGIADGAVSARGGASVFEGYFLGVFDFTGGAAFEAVGFHQVSLQVSGIEGRGAWAESHERRFHRGDLSLSFQAEREVGSRKQVAGDDFRFLTAFGMTRLGVRDDGVGR